MSNIKAIYKFNFENDKLIKKVIDFFYEKIYERLELDFKIDYNKKLVYIYILNFDDDVKDIYEKDNFELIEDIIYFLSDASDAIEDENEIFYNYKKYIISTLEKVI